MPSPHPKMFWSYMYVNDTFFDLGPVSWVPYDEETAIRLEEEYAAGIATGQWKREIRLESSKEAIRMIAPNIMFHLPSEQSSLSERKLDEWGQVRRFTISACVRSDLGC